MDITAIRNDPNPEGRVLQEILPHMKTKSAIALLLDRNINEESDALSAVKLDPAVLEAQITMNRSVKNEPTPAAFIRETKDAESQRRFDFDRVMNMHRPAIMSLSEQQLDLLMQYVDTMRRQWHSTQKQLECAFCKNTGHGVRFTAHTLKDGSGRVRCPVLRALSCRRCGATGDYAHTFKYCPNK